MNNNSYYNYDYNNIYAGYKQNSNNMNIYNHNNLNTDSDTYNYDNNNYNIPTFSNDENPSSLYSPYEGFIRGNMFPSLYNTYKINKPYQIEPLNEQAEMLTNLDMLSFAALDLSLYLDVYPNDKDILNLFNKYREQAGKATLEYEKKFGPINKSSSANNAYPWQWANKPWPWEN